VAALLRGQRALGRALRAPLRARDGEARLGQDPLHLERIGPQHPARDDPLRHVEDRAACHLARPGDGAQRHRRHRQRRAAGPTRTGTPSAARRTRKASGKMSGSDGFLPRLPPDSILRVSPPPGSRQPGRLPLRRGPSATTGAALPDGGIVNQIM
jgi:hypothetical protein